MNMVLVRQIIAGVSLSGIMSVIACDTVDETSDVAGHPEDVGETVTTGLGGSPYQRDHRYPGTHPLVRRRFFALPAAARGRAWSRRSPTAALRSGRFSPVRAASRSGVRVAEAFLEDEVL
jgi:hypothetical protein